MLALPVVEIKVLPVGTIVPSMSSYVRACYEAAQNDDTLDVTLTPTSTILEGEWSHLWPVLEAMHQAPFEQGVDRVVTAITIDERRDKPQNMDSMVSSVLEDEAH